jgi:tyrosine-protein kinase Etk/Wzc
MVKPIQTNPDQEDQFDLVSLIDIFLDSRWLIAIVCVSLTLMGTLYAFVTPPIYESDIMVQVEDAADSAAKSFLGDVSSLFSEKSSAAAEIQIITSRLVVSDAVDNLHLYIAASPLRFPVLGNLVAKFNSGLSSPGLVRLGSRFVVGQGYTWGDEAIDVTKFDVPSELEAEKFRITNLGNGTYSLSGRHVDQPLIGRVGRLEHFSLEAGGVELMVKSIDSLPDAEFNVIRFSRLKTITDLQANLDAQEKVKQSDVVVASLQGKNPFLIARVLNEIGREYIKQNVERKSAEAAQSLEFLNAQLPILKGRLEDAESRYTQMQNRSGTIDLTEQAKLTLQQVADSKARYLQLVQQRAELLSRFNASHPAIRALDEQISALKNYGDAYDEQVKKMPNVQQQATRLLLDVTVNSDLYTGLLNNAQQLQLVRAGKVGNVRLIDTAERPEEPIKPRKALIILASALLGFSLGIAVALLRNTLFRGITDPSEIERHLGLSVYATIPLSERQSLLTKELRKPDGAKTVLASDSPSDVAIESLRSFRTALQFAMVNARNNVVLISGSAPGVGKSFVAANIAAVLALGGKKVLLIDADLRKGHINKYFGLSRERGLSDVIVEDVSPADAIRRDILPNLDMLVTGKLPPNPAELLLSKQLPKLIENLASSYDIVIVDGPPILAAADTGILASHAGTVFLVALSGVTRMGELSESIKRLVQAGSQPSGVLFNGVNPTLSQYGYGSKYGSYRYQAYQYDGSDIK